MVDAMMDASPALGSLSRGFCVSGSIFCSFIASTVHHVVLAPGLWQCSTKTPHARDCPLRPHKITQEERAPSPHTSCLAPSERAMDDTWQPKVRSSMSCAAPAARDVVLPARSQSRGPTSKEPAWYIGSTTFYRSSSAPTRSNVCAWSSSVTCAHVHLLPSLDPVRGGPQRYIRH